jgi:hypothetical protein
VTRLNSGPPIPVPLVVPPSVDSLVVAYLTDNEVSLSAWDQLMGICYSFVGPLFLKDDFGDYKVERTRQNDEGTGRLGGKRTRLEGSANVTRRWIQEWLLERLSAYRGQTRADIQKAAERDEFRYLGRQCRNALIDRLRKVEGSPRIVRLDEPIGEDGDTFGHLIGTWNAGGQSSLYCPSVCREDLIEFINENKDALADVIVELMAFIKCYFDGDVVVTDTIAGAVTDTIAESRNIETRQARTYKQRFLDLARRSSNPALRELFDLLQPKSHIFVRRKEC